MSRFPQNILYFMQLCFLMILMFHWFSHIIVIIQQCKQSMLSQSTHVNYRSVKHSWASIALHDSLHTLVYRSVKHSWASWALYISLHIQHPHHPCSEKQCLVPEHKTVVYLQHLWFGFSQFVLEQVIISPVFNPTHST